MSGEASGSRAQSTIVLDDSIGRLRACASARATQIVRASKLAGRTAAKAAAAATALVGAAGTPGISGSSSIKYGLCASVEKNASPAATEPSHSVTIAVIDCEPRRLSLSDGRTMLTHLSCPASPALSAAAAVAAAMRPGHRPAHRRKQGGARIRYQGRPHGSGR